MLTKFSSNSEYLDPTYSTCIISVVTKTVYNIPFLALLNF